MTTAPTPTLSPAKPTASSTGMPMLDRLMATRPLVRIAILAIIAITIWIAAEDYTWKAADDLNAESNRIESVLSDAASRGSMIEGSDEIKAAIHTFGRIRIPREERSGTEALQKSIARVMKDLKITYELDVRNAGRFPSGTFPGIAAAGERVEKVIGDMKFRASQATAINVVERLEASEDIESVSRVKFTKNSEAKGELAVLLTVEAWVRVPDTRQR